MHHGDLRAGLGADPDDDVTGGGLPRRAPTKVITTGSATSTPAGMSTSSTEVLAAQARADGRSVGSWPASTLERRGLVTGDPADR